MSRETLSEVAFEELLPRARAGEERAFAELFRRSRPTIDKLIARQRGSLQTEGARPSDMSQELSERVLRGFASFRGNTAGEWFKWLGIIFRNSRAEATRRAHAQKRETAGVVSLDSEEAAGERSPAKSPSQIALHEEEWRRLIVYIYQLDEEQSAAIYLHHVKGLPIAEVARLRQKTTKSVDGLLYRGWEQVKARMRNEPAPAPELSPESTPTSRAAIAFMDYVRRCDEGELIAPEAFIAEYPTCADELRDMIHWIDGLRAYRPKPSQK